MSLVLGFGALIVAVQTDGGAGLFWFGVAVGAFTCSYRSNQPPPA